MSDTGVLLSHQSGRLRRVSSTNHDALSNQVQPCIVQKLHTAVFAVQSQV